MSRLPIRLHRAKDGITRATLTNGLRVVAREMHASPVVALCVWYRVGSRNEHDGITGISHWVEHMMFKGTRKYSESDLDRLVSRNGGVHNAFTWIDFTAYYETMPAGKIGLALDLEADRMVNARFDKRDVARERTVIVNERQMYENSPDFRLAEEVQAAAFKVHPYGHEVIGHACDLQAITRDDLYAHYRRYYAPNNAVVAIAGDFDARDMLAQIERRFGRLKPAPKIPPVTASEPPQKGERRVVVRGEGDTDYLALAFHAPAAIHEDYMALVALDSVLCGASGLSFFGGGTSNRSSRLSKALVDSGYAADVGGGLVPTIDPFLYTLYVTVMPGKVIGEVEDRLWDELERVRREGVTPAELEKAIKQTRAQVTFSTETATTQAFWLGFSEVIADYTWFTTFLSRLARVTPDDVSRVANRYLARDNVTVGHYLAWKDGQSAKRDKDVVHA
ncbi:MAG: insulinase family protein [Anaerolineae bacterium]|nr:insulinase family protein [Anaerolineae bacterium]